MLHLLVSTALAACPTTGTCAVLPLGDSITDGYNVPGGYRVDLEDLLVADGVAVDFVGALQNGPRGLADKDHEGHSGWRIDQIQRIIRDRMTRYAPDVVLVHLGTNDVFQGYDLANAPARMNNLLATIFSANPDATVLVAGIIPASTSSYDALIVDYNADVEGVVDGWAASGWDAHYVDHHTGFSTSLLADGVHPNRAGYAQMATTWFAAWQAILP